MLVLAVKKVIHAVSAADTGAMGVLNFDKIQFIYYRYPIARGEATLSSHQLRFVYVGIIVCATWGHDSRFIDRVCHVHNF